MKNQNVDDTLKVRRIAFLILLVIVTAAFFELINELLMACFWASILAIIFSSLNTWLVKKLKGHRNTAAILTTLFILVSVIAPLFLLTIAVMNETTELYETLEAGDLDAEGIIQDVRDMVPAAERALVRFGVDPDMADERVEAFSSKLMQGVGERAVQTTQNALNFVVQFALMLYLLFFFIRDGKKITDGIKNTLPIGNKIEEAIFKKFADVARATLKGTLVVAIIQGTIGGITFAALGIPGAIVWGVIMILLSLLPVGGSMFVWVPTAIVLFASGQVMEGVILTIVGALFIGVIDNLLRPRLVGRETKMPDYLVLLATLGGLAQFGLTGFIIGPVIAALFMTMWEITGSLFGGSVD